MMSAVQLMVADHVTKTTSTLTFAIYRRGESFMRFTFKNNKTKNCIFGVFSLYGQYKISDGLLVLILIRADGRERVFGLRRVSRLKILKKKKKN